MEVNYTNDFNSKEGLIGKTTPSAEIGLFTLFSMLNIFYGTLKQFVC